MLRASLSAALLVAIGWGVPVSSASAQALRASMRIEFTPYFALYYTGGGQQVFCTSEDPGGPGKGVASAGPNISDGDVVYQTFYCGDVQIDIFRYVWTADNGGVDEDANLTFPNAFEIRTTVEVISDRGAGPHVMVLDQTQRISLSEGGTAGMSHDIPRSIPGTWWVRFSDGLDWEIET